MTSHAVHSLLARWTRPRLSCFATSTYSRDDVATFLPLSSICWLLVVSRSVTQSSSWLLITLIISGVLVLIWSTDYEQPSLNRSRFLASQISCQVGLDYQFCSVGLFFSIFENIIAWCLPLCLQWSFLVTISCKNWVNCKQTIVL